MSSKTTEEDPMMNELASTLGGSFVVNSKEKNSIYAQHPRFAQYKNSGKNDPDSHQEKRRKIILEHQKKRREDYVNFARALAIGDVDQEDEEEEESMDIEKYRPKKLKKSFKNQLMLSEWLVEVPEDFHDTWLMVLSPVGRRCLVVAGDGSTNHYARNGHKVRSFSSALPGGSRGPSRSKCTILDCIYVEQEKTYYVLDLMMWADYPLYECETEFRFFWLKSKLDENPKLSKTSKVNWFKFAGLPSCKTEKSTLEQVLLKNQKVDMNPELDGLLFYHSKAHYIPGSTPLVGWLKGYMVREVLGLEVSGEFLRNAPLDYQGVQDFIVKFDEERKSLIDQRKLFQQQKRENKKACKMDSQMDSSTLSESSFNEDLSVCDGNEEIKML